MSFANDDFLGAETDFFSFALHEVGHVLGISESNESWTNNNPFSVAPDGGHSRKEPQAPVDCPADRIADGQHRRLRWATQIADHDRLRRSQKSRLEVPEIFLADFNDDDSVNADDLAQWQGDYGQNGQSDSDHDHDSDGRDFLAWQRGIGLIGNAAPVSHAVPEPTTICMSALALLLTLGRSSGQRAHPTSPQRLATKTKTCHNGSNAS